PNSRGPTSSPCCVRWKKIDVLLGLQAEDSGSMTLPRFLLQRTMPRGRLGFRRVSPCVGDFTEIASPTRVSPQVSHVSTGMTSGPPDRRSCNWESIQDA